MISYSDIEKSARAEASFDGKLFDGVPPAEKQRYMDRAKLTLEAVGYSSWFPIEAANRREGERILLYVVCPPNEYAEAIGIPEGWEQTEIGYWSDHSKGWDHATLGTPTHFKPLDRPPE